MTASDYLVLEIHRQREQELIRNLERRRILAEHLDRMPARTARHSGILTAAGDRLNRLQALVRHQPVRG